jgi:hypothetical protein
MILTCDAYLSLMNILKTNAVNDDIVLTWLSDRLDKQYLPDVIPKFEELIDVTPLPNSIDIVEFIQWLQRNMDLFLSNCTIKSYKYSYVEEETDNDVIFVVIITFDLNIEKLIQQYGENQSLLLTIFKR